MYENETNSGLENAASKLNISDTISDTASKVIKQLSGTEHKGKKRVIDNIIAFISPSGGTGVSTIVANVAQEIVGRNLSVLLVDTNICYPSQHIYFRLKQESEKKDLISFLTGKNTIGESIEYKGELGVLVANNRNIMDYINCDNKIISNNMTECLERMSSLFDVVLVDCTNSIEYDMISAVLYRSDSIYCVWDEGISSISNFDRLRSNMRALGIDGNKMKVILNKKTNVYYRESVFKSLNADLVEVIPFDTAVIESGLRGEIFIKKGESNSKTAKGFVKGISKLSSKILQLGGFRNER